MGAQTYRLPCGHRGTNHPVRDLETGRIYITTQNHGYAIDESSLTKTGLEVTMRSLNDGSIEGIRHQSLNIFSVQFDPESYPDYSETGFSTIDLYSSCRLILKEEKECPLNPV